MFVKRATAVDCAGVASAAAPGLRRRRRVGLQELAHAAGEGAGVGQRLALDDADLIQQEPDQLVTRDLASPIAELRKARRLLTHAGPKAEHRAGTHGNIFAKRLPFMLLARHELSPDPWQLGQGGLR